MVIQESKKICEESTNTRWSYTTIFFICRLYFESDDKTIKTSALMMLGQILLRCKNYIPAIFCDLKFEFETFFRGKHPIEKLYAIVLYCYERTKNDFENADINKEITKGAKQDFEQFLEKIIVGKRNINDYKEIDVVQMISLIFDYLARHVSKINKNQFLLYAKQNILFSAYYMGYSSPSKLLTEELSTEVSIFHVDDDTVTILINGVKEELVPSRFTWDSYDIDILQGLGIVKFSPSLSQSEHQHLLGTFVL